MEEQNNNNETKQEAYIPIFKGEVTCNAVFRKIQMRYSAPIGLFIGRVCVAQYEIDAAIPKEDPKKFRVITPLPSLPKDMGRFETEKECKSRCVSIAIAFFNQLAGIENN